MAAEYGEQDRWADLPTKLKSLRGLAEQTGCDTVVLTDPANLAWLLGGRVNVPQTLDTACLDVVVTVAGGSPQLRIVTNRIEAPRLQDVELPGVDAEWHVVDWWQPRVAELPSGDRVAADRPTGGSTSIAGQLSALRRTLTDREQQRLRDVCRDTASAATAAAGVLTPATTEYAAAGILAGELLARGLDPIVLLVAGQHHIAAHRHPLPTMDPLGDRAMLVACGRRAGLVASVTRITSFRPLDAAQQDAYRRILRVEQAFLDGTRAGVRIGDVVQDGTAAYAAQGLDPLEWHRHHQGGFSGWQPREFPAHAGSDAVVPDGGVVAWNPSGGGWKVEDTTLVRGDTAEPLVLDDAWPTVEVGGRPRPDVLIA